MLFVAAVVVLATVLVWTNLSAASEGPYAEFAERADLPADEQTAYAPPSDGLTVVTSHRNGDIVAFAADGTVAYHDGRHDGYWDVDPSPVGDRTVVYSTTDKVANEGVCDPVDGEKYCIRQSIERANLTTGEVTTLYTRVDPRYHASEWHDVDPLGGNRFLVGDMYADEVFVVNATTGLVEWEWAVQSFAPLSGGGDYPADWAHLNDVERLDDGRIMVSLRNQDQVVFVHPENGSVDAAWTLGEDDDHGVLYEQHNPDFIPAERGGPAVVLADSERNRIVEYQRTDGGGWERTWAWSDDRLQWPRDADRLPSGNTLVSDTHGGRVFEVAPNGSVAWSVDVPSPYEAERLGTGDESAGGPSATKAGLQSREAESAESSESRGGLLAGFREGVYALIPNKVVNGLTSVLPVWVGFSDLAIVALLLCVLASWGVAEARWSNVRVRSPLVRGD